MWPAWTSTYIGTFLSEAMQQGLVITAKKLNLEAS
jgi:hypothetical protein